MTTTYPGAIDALPRPSPSTVMQPPYGGSGVVDNISDAIEAIEAQLGATTVAAADSLGYVRLSDAAGKGLWVPRAAIAPHPLTINSNYTHWQRGGGAARTATTTYSTDTSYAADRFYTLPVGASVTVSRSTSVPDVRSKYSLSITGAASVTTVDHGQRLVSELGGGYRRPLLFRAWIYNGTGAAMTPNLRIGTPSADNNFTTVTNRLDQALQACPDATWTEVYHVFDPSGYTNIANGLEVALRFPSGSLTAAKSVGIAQFELRPSTVRQPYAAPDPDLELARCLPYYQRFLPDASGVNLAFATGYAFSTTLSLQVFTFRTMMRTAPTIAISSMAHFGLSPASITITSFSGTSANHGSRLDVGCSGGGLTTGAPYNLQSVSTSSWIEARAEV